MAFSVVLFLNCNLKQLYRCLMWCAGYFAVTDFVFSRQFLPK